MRIRNDRDVTLAVYHLHLHVPPGGHATVPAGSRVPDGFSVVAPPPTTGKKKRAGTSDHQEP